MTAREKVECLAQILHESGREAVNQRKIYRDDVPVKPFCEWAALPEPAKEGRRMMAVYLQSQYHTVIDLLEGTNDEFEDDKAADGDE